MQVTARSKNPIPMTCSVFRVTESQTRTCGGNCYKTDTERTAETTVAKNHHDLKTMRMHPKNHSDAVYGMKFLSPSLESPRSAQQGHK